MASLFSPVPSLRPSSPPTATPTTDFALIESQKENIRPLASGRSAATLSTLFEKDTAAERVLQEGHERFSRAVEEAERRDREGEDMVEGVPDLLDVYYQYVLFTVQNSPASAIHILPLLESTTRRFLSDARYGQDARYLKMWVMYTRHVERREEVWAFLESRDVGTRHAVFYEEWASAAEALHRRKKTDEIYRLGIARKAAPLERLKSRHHAFLERIMVSPTDTIPEDEPAMSLRTPGRSILGGVTSIPATLSGATQLAPANRLPKSTNGAKLDIFSDVTGQGDDAAPGEWADFGTRDGRRKENTVEAGPWKGETLPQSAARGRIAPRTPKVEVFRDSNDNQAVRPADDVLSRSKQQFNEAELLKLDPLRYYDTSAVSSAVPSMPSLPPPPSTRKPSRPAKASSSQFVMQPWVCPTGGPDAKGNGCKVERRMFDWTNVYKGGEEWSFEEVRARQRGLLGKDWRGDVKEWESGWHKPGSSTPKAEKKKSMPSPTVNTKLANEEVLTMFDQTIHGGKVRDSDNESDEDSEDDEVPVQTAPTPLPSGPGTAAMLVAAGGMVPPTPTPASGYVTQNRPLQSNVCADEDASPAPPTLLNDENAIPSSAMRPAKLNVFSETPAKTPLTDRAPFSASGSKPRAFGVFEEPPTPRLPPLVNAFATPAPMSRVPGRGTELASAIPEETEDVEAEDEEQILTRVIEEHHIDIDDEADDEDPPARRRRFNVHEMTPITERTCEFTTQMTTLRSSQCGATSATRRVSAVRSEVDADEACVEEAAQPAPVLNTVVEEEARPSRMGERTSSPDQSVDSASLPEGHRSGSVETGFQLPEGFTIHQHGHTAMSMHTMVLIDGVETQTMHTAREGSPDSTFVTARASQAGLPNPCNPADEDVVGALIAAIDPPLCALPDFRDHRDVMSGRLHALQKHAKAKVRRASSSSRVSAVADEPKSFELGGKAFEIEDKIGEGGFGAVFLAIDVAARDLADAANDDEDDEEEDNYLVAVKVENPTSVWEAVVLDRIHRRLVKNHRPSIIRPRSLYAFQDESFLLLDYSSQGTLLDLVNKATQMGIAPAVAGAPSAVDELLAIFLTIELLRLVESLHQANFLHGDLKIDNCLVRLEPTNSAAWSTTYDRNGANGWSAKGVKLIDFGRAIDLTLFPAGVDQTFVADWKVDERDCVEMREAKPWSYQTDYFGLASVCYCLLFGKYISTEVVADPDSSGKKYKIATTLRRYWQTNLWTSLFDALLNPKSMREDKKLPITDELATIRGRFEDWLEENCQKGGKSLKAMLKKVELAAITGRRG